MRKRWLALLLGLVPSMVWAQELPGSLPAKFDFWTAEPVLTMDMVHKMPMVSGGCNGYSFGKTIYTLLAPSDIALQGGVTATMTIQAYDANGNPLSGSILSHNITVVANSTTGTWVGPSWTSNHGVSGTIYETIDNDPTVVATYNVGTSGSSPHWSFMNNSTVGHTYHLKYVVPDANGNATQDRVNVSVVSSTGPGVTNQDGVHTNAYFQANPNFGGGDMMHTCQICIDYPSACSGAQHTPYISGSMTNHTSGEVQTFQRLQAGNVVGENSPISGSAFWAISVLPGDNTDGEATGEIFCSAVADDIFNQNNPNNDGLGVPGIELAWFKGTIKQSTCKLFNYKGNAGVDCKYLYGTQSNGSRTFPMCTTRTWIPDFQPNDVFIPANMVPGYPDLALVPPFYFALSAGLRWPNLPGYPWQFPFYYLDQVTPVLPTALAQVTDLLNWTFISQNSKIRDCTSADNGYQVLIYFPGVD